MAGPVTVEEVTGGKALVRFIELPQVLHGVDPRWAPPVMAWERYRLDPRRNPYFEHGDGVYLLARRLGRPVGRLVAHVPDRSGAEGRFGFWCCIDDDDVAAALVEAARAWLSDQGCDSMTGPLSFDVADEPGVLSAGFDVAGLTGRPWNPEWEARLLRDLGFDPVADQHMWRLPARAGATASTLALGAAMPGHAGPYADPRLVLDGVAAVPDVSDALRHSSLRTAWRLAARARARDWDTCTIVSCSHEPALAVTAMQAAASAAGYSTVIAPWSPQPGSPPETLHRLLRLSW